jgi:hypothetical protein
MGESHGLTGEMGIKVGEGAGGLGQIELLIGGMGLVWREARNCAQ